ncbi:efflux RND transporter periplasmic adaptor subunit [Leptolyngbya sp. NIES-2104]|uniref:efflux RND transporter periplasmic adaptor subunit n=1 Tax=Leptolyngbya sp. NIES-2104 TaxID=1552121 RepID=UPI0006EC4498|nr:efflux RND transporter periplasmic adaptor subunit [Leptolyngbya sp. NIES-2104]GAP99484.1 probable RND efflux membrane fusion protein [Leptolyngbya sp. NIES-2104]
MDSSNFSATDSPSEKVSRSRRARMWWLLGLLLLGGGGLGVWQVLARREPVPTTAPPPSMPVKTLTLQSRLLQERSELIANLRSRRSVTLRPQIQGRVTRILVTPGAQVSAGTVLAQVDPAQQQAAVNSNSAATESAQAEVATARATLRSLEAEQRSKLSDVKLAQQDYNRYSQLAAAGAISQQTRDQYANRLEVARASLGAVEEQTQAQQATVLQAEKGVQEARSRTQEQQVQLQFFQITAPFQGTVGEIPAKVGDLVDPSTQIVTIVDNTALEVNFSIPAEQVSQVNIGDLVELVDNRGQRLGTSRVFFIAPNTTGTTQSILVKTLIDNPDGRLRTEQFVRARIIQSQRPGVVVPTTAITRLGGEAFVYVVEPAQSGFVARQRLLKLGAIEGNDYQVLDGLRAGERVIVSGVLALRDGMPITPES